MLAVWLGRSGALRADSQVVNGGASRSGRPTSYREVAPVRAIGREAEFGNLRTRRSWLFEDQQQFGRDRERD